MISKQALEGLIDSCNRVVRALGNVQRLSMAAASAFAEEQGVANDVKQALEALRR